MPLVDSIETYIIGSISEIKTWSLKDWIWVGVRVFILLEYIILESLFSAVKYVFEIITEGNIYQKILVFNNRVWRRIPAIGGYGIKCMPYCSQWLRKNLLPKLEKLQIMIQLLYQIHFVEMTFKDKKRVQIFITGESDTLEIFENNKQLTTLIISNHRSLNDYNLINYLIQNCCPKKITKWDVVKNCITYKDTDYTKVNFLSWGKIINFPHLSFIRNIMTKDENVTIPTKEIKKNLLDNGNQVLVIFPEVNILTTELSLVQRKLNQDYAFVARFYNVLYPRFKEFIETIKCFANINHIKRQTQNNILFGSKVFLNDKMEKFVTKLTYSNKINNIPDEGSLKKDTVVLGISSLIKNQSFGNSDKHEEGDNEPHDNSSNIKINDYLYDLTVIYYRPKYTQKGHDHVNGNLKLHEGYQLEQINPSILEMLRPDNNSIQPPIVIMINILKHEINSLLALKNQSLEKWLENQWQVKDNLIDSIENGIKLT